VYKGGIDEMWDIQDQDLTFKDTVVRKGHPVLFGLLLLFGIIEGATTSYLGEL
jgi:hypothetical protein